jgi:hypothetical protein
MPDLTYAVHTAACTYLLDDEGVCRSITVSPPPPPGTERCIGAQFVASLDVHIEGGLSGELCIGAAALFVAAHEGRFVLMRTQPIERVEILGAVPGGPPPPRASLPDGDDPYSFAPTPIYERAAHGVPEQRLPAYDVEETALLDPRWSSPGSVDEQPMDLEDFLSISVTEVTVSLPLYRPQAPPSGAAPPHPPPRPVVKPGRRLG